MNWTIEALKQVSDPALLAELSPQVQGTVTTMTTAVRELAKEDAGVEDVLAVAADLIPEELADVIVDKATEVVTSTLSDMGVDVARGLGIVADVADAIPLISTIYQIGEAMAFGIDLAQSAYSQPKSEEEKRLNCLAKYRPVQGSVGAVTLPIDVLKDPDRNGSLYSGSHVSYAFEMLEHLFYRGRREGKGIVEETEHGIIFYDWDVKRHILPRFRPDQIEVYKEGLPGIVTSMSATLADIRAHQQKEANIGISVESAYRLFALRKACIEAGERYRESKGKVGDGGLALFSVYIDAIRREFRRGSLSWGFVWASYNWQGGKYRTTDGPWPIPVCWKYDARSFDLMKGTVEAWGVETEKVTVKRRAIDAAARVSVELSKPQKPRMRLAIKLQAREQIRGVARAQERVRRRMLRGGLFRELARERAARTLGSVFDTILARTTA